MSVLNLHAGYFSPGNPFKWLDRCFNRYCHQQAVELNRRPLLLCWTQRAQRQFEQSEQSLVVEMQLYFSCVVKKRVLFHHHRDIDSSQLNQRFGVSFSAVSSAACDPVEFAKNYPQGKDLSAGLTSNMSPKRVEIDFCRGRWEGQFSLV